MGECGVILKVVEPVKSFVFDSVREYVGYIGSCEVNLGALRKSLSDVCIKKDDINKKVLLGKDKQEEITSEAASWLQDVRMLVEGEELKSIMYKDIETAKFVVKIMRKKDLKRRISMEGEMQELVVRVMKKLKEEIEHIKEEEMRKIREADYKNVAEVVVEVMKDTIGEFKKLMKEDKKMAVVAMRTLNGRELRKLTKGDQEMEEIVKEAGNTSDEEQWPNHADEESNTLQPLLVKIPEVDVGKNRVKEAAKKLFSPLATLVTPLGKLMDDANFKKVVPEAEGVKLGLEVIDGLLIKGRGLNKEMDDNTKQQRGCCCCSLFSLCNDYHHRYLISKSAEFMAKHIQDELITSSTFPQDPVTLRIRAVDLKPIPTQFLKGLDSRSQLLDQILVKFADVQVNYVGVFGMGGTGKTTLAKEVIKRVKDAYVIKVMVEVSDAPDFVRIQTAIAESIDLPLNDVDNVAQRAIRLYNRLISEKEKKILIILDNVWKKLDLNEIGIPHTCSLLLTTRDREVCRVMNVRDDNILEVGLMNTNEARELFKSHSGNQVDIGKYKNVVDRLLTKCGGLPLAIVATANSLKDKDLSSWEKFANDLEKPISSQISEKDIFPVGSSASIESLVRYSMGLNLFEHMNNLSEAIEQAITWADELKLSSMLLEGDVKGAIKIHDIVRAFAISHAAKGEEHKFMVERIPRWLDDETLKKYTAMSLTSMNDHSRLSGVEACKLQILILKGNISLNFDDFFFKGMVNLEVLALSDMNFQPSLPESMRKLKKLRTLCLENCKLGDIKLVGELVNLLVLSLRASFLKSLPEEVGNLWKLRLLDLNECTISELPLIPNGVLSKLSRLEGLYMFNTRSPVSKTNLYRQEPIALENLRLPYLNALEIKVAAARQLPLDGQLAANVDKFKICVGKDYFTNKIRQNFSCILNLDSVSENSGLLKKGCLKILLKKADLLVMRYYHNFEDLVPQLDQEGFTSLRYLSLFGCSDIKCIVDGHTMNNLVAFQCLESLHLKKLKRLDTVCHGDVSPGTFRNLKSIHLSELNGLLYGLPLIPPNVSEIFVSSCKLFKFMFMEDEEVLSIKLLFLKTLKLSDIPCLLSLVGPKKFISTSEALQAPQYFFDGKIDFPCLEALRVISVNNEVSGVWDKQLLSVTSNPAPMLKQLALGSTTGLRQIPSIVLENLSSLTLVRFEDVDAVFSSSSHLGMKKGFSWIYSQLPNLKELKVKDSDSLKELFEKKDDNVIDDALTSFCGQIKTLELNTLPSLNIIHLPLFKNIASLTLFELGWQFLISAHVLGDILHLLQFLSIEDCHSMQALVIGVDLHFTFPRLKTLRLWNLRSFGGMAFASKKGTALHLPSLETLEIKNCKELRHFWSGSIVASRLQDVSLDNCNKMLQFVVGNLEDTIELPSLEKVSIQYCHLFESFSSKSLNAPKLREVKLMGCPLMECFLPGALNDDGDLQLPSLEIVYIADCPSLSAFSLRRAVAHKSVHWISPGGWVSSDSPNFRISDGGRVSRVRGDVTLSLCHRCVQEAIQYILPKCPEQKEINVWYEQCTLRYANRDIFAMAETKPWVMDNYTAAYAPDPGQFEQVLSDTMESLINMAAEDRTSHGFAAGEGLLSSSLTLYCLVQCTPDLIAQDCYTCLNFTFDRRRVHDCCSGPRLRLFIFRPSCQLMWDTTRFYSVSSPPSKDKNGIGYYLIRAGIPVAGVLALLLCVIAVYVLRTRRNQQTPDFRPVDTKTDRATEGAVQYDMETIRAATKNFSMENKLGHGGFGTVYKGTLRDGQEVAVKRISEGSRQGIREFASEVELLAPLQHRNLVRLLGFCEEGEEKLIVYEFMPNMSLDKFLFGRPDQNEYLDWQTRFAIIKGIARGLLYLHQDSRLTLIHRDLKPNNILLDHEMNPKIADFGLARLVNLDQTQARTTNIFGTLGYMAPEYKNTGVFSAKSDVYSFGVLLLEIISWQINYSANQSQDTGNLISRTRRLENTDDVMELVHEAIRTNVSKDEVYKCVRIALHCVQDAATDRPNMASVLVMLSIHFSDVPPLPRPSSPLSSISVTQDSNRPEQSEFNRPNLQLYSTDNFTNTNQA
ncbi:hypothetical protein KSS87_018510 [Heliosperma pusillum]|nr:hypothetical protein KSS87_018510 [Heliosperma pusillum]